MHSRPHYYDGLCLPFGPKFCHRQIIFIAGRGFRVLRNLSLGIVGSAGSPSWTPAYFFSYSFLTLPSRYSPIFSFARSIHFPPFSDLLVASYILLLHEPECGRLGRMPAASLLQPSLLCVFMLPALELLRTGFFRHIFIPRWPHTGNFDVDWSVEPNPGRYVQSWLTWVWSLWGALHI